MAGPAPLRLRFADTSAIVNQRPPAQPPPRETIIPEYEGREETFSIAEQISDAYRRMAYKARYRPAAPSDGLGNITVPLEELDLEEEAKRYAAWWWKEEDGGDFTIGRCNFPTRPATIFAIEAARSMCGANDELAVVLLSMALADVVERVKAAHG